VRLAAKLLGWKIDIKSEEEKRQEVEQQMQALAGGPTTPIEQVNELGETIIQKLVAAGITTVESLADMTPEQLEEIPGIGEKTLEKISVAVRHYFGHFEEGEGPSAEAAGSGASSGSAESTEGEPPTDEVEDSAPTYTIKPTDGEAEVPTPPEAEDTAEAERENADEVLEEVDQSRMTEAENDNLAAADGRDEALAEELAEEQSMTVEELAVEDVPPPDEVAELPELDRGDDEIDNERTETDEGGA
jgi:N utilization substance protein A